MGIGDGSSGCMGTPPLGPGPPLLGPAPKLPGPAPPLLGPRGPLPDVSPLNPRRASIGCAKASRAGSPSVAALSRPLGTGGELEILPFHSSLCSSCL